MDDLLSVSAAADRLGVHVATIRRWTDEGDLPVVRTPGGHRRIPASAVAAMRERTTLVADGPRDGSVAPSPADRAWAEHAIVHTRFEVQTHPDAAWNQELTREAREHRRETGRQLIGLLLRHVAGQGDAEARSAETRRIAWGYALEMKDRGLRLTEALRATLFFRDVLTESTAFYPRFDGAGGSTGESDPIALMRRVNEFMNEVQLTIAEAYENEDA